MSATTVRADWVLPIAERPIRNGAVTVADGRIVAVLSEPPPDAVDLGSVAILPALVNAHTHIELSYLAGRIPAGDSLIAWVRAVMAARRAQPDPVAPAIVDAARTAIAQARTFGTGVLGDVSNTLVTVRLLRDAGMPAQVFHELLGFREADGGARVAAARRALAEAAGPEGPDSGPVRISLAPHAPYSVSPDLFTAIRADLDLAPRRISSVHLGESREELELLRRGAGPWRTLLDELGAWTDEWRIPGNSPVAYLSKLGFLDSRVLAVHGVQFDGEDLSQLSALGVTVVACPRSNVHVGVGPPPIEAFYAMDVDVAFGTDSLASAPDLNVFAELAEARRLAPRVPARRLLASATLVGARGLGFDREFGSIEPRKRGDLLVAALPEKTTDPEEYLVSGIRVAAIRWLDDVLRESAIVRHA